MINQTNFPLLWLLFQYVVGGTVGGTVDKKRLVLKTYHGERKVLEVGCSVGNIADTFLSIDEIQYQGLDIDASAIKVAQQRFKKYPNFIFTCADFNQFSETGQKFDVVYFAGVLHHISDQEALSILQSAISLLDVHTRLLIIEPQLAQDNDPALVRWYANSLEQGHYLQSMESLQGIVRLVPGLTIQSVSLRRLAPPLFPGRIAPTLSSLKPADLYKKFEGIKS